MARVTTHSEDLVDQLMGQWRDVRPAVATVHLEAAKRVQLVAASLEQYARVALAEHDVDGGEFDVLATLLRQGAPYELSPSALAREALVSTSGMTKRLDRLERRRLLRRRSDPHDRRAVLVRLSDDGIALARQAVPQQADAMRAALAGVSEADVAELCRLLRPEPIART